MILAYIQEYLKILLFYFKVLSFTHLIKNLLEYAIDKRYHKIP